MQKTTFLFPETMYHIFNRCTNKQSIFLDENDYAKFFFLWEKYAEPIMDIYAYCLLPNHFHFLVKIKSEKELRLLKDFKDIDNERITYRVSNSISNLFNAYSRYFNIKYDRSGKVFTERFKRKPILTDAYFSKLIDYIHKNPEKHELVDDFRDYAYSSYWLHLIDQPTRLKVKEVLDWFGGRDEYVNFHADTYEVIS